MTQANGLDSRSVRTRENPVARLVVWSFQFPSPEHVCNFGIHGNRFARNFRFAGSNDLTGNRASDVQFELIESHIFPLQSQEFSLRVIRLPHRESPQSGMVPCNRRIAVEFPRLTTQLESWSAWRSDELL